MLSAARPFRLVGNPHKAAYLESRLASGPDGVTVVILSGPSGSGKTSLVNEAIRKRAGGVVWLTFDGSDKLSDVASRCEKFSRSSSAGVFAALSGGSPSSGERAKGIFLDDVLDQKNAAGVVDSLRRLRPRVSVFVVVSLGPRQTGAGALRNPGLRVDLRHPRVDDALAYMLEEVEAAGAPWSLIAPEEIIACVRGCDGCVPRSISAIESLAAGMSSKDIMSAGQDRTIFDKVKRAVFMAESGADPLLVAHEISSEPAVSTMILINSVLPEYLKAKGAKGGREEYVSALRDYLYLTAAIEGCGQDAYTPLFLRLCRGVRASKVELKFPQAYTVASNRASRIRASSAA